MNCGFVPATAGLLILGLVAPNLAAQNVEPTSPEDSGMLQITTIKHSLLVKKLVNMSAAQLQKLNEGKRRGWLELSPLPRQATVRSLWNTREGRFDRMIRARPGTTSRIVLEGRWSLEFVCG